MGRPARDAMQRKRAPGHLANSRITQHLLARVDDTLLEPVNE